ncbi:ATP-binding protein [Pseudomonas sp. TUM22785]|uniref:ATP-binding protein n=1 Tax=Pseudomonas sp. TUM22785 TaxID=3019098 RepID=UPI002304D812|nr:ATP-binding protein [Pseudomonas sp. TUM22785]WCD79611.1 ATP-binding protein [Pseudomonas sp. TUM22785]
MTVFVAGVHGVGKTYLCQQYAGAFPVLHESASGLIRRERAQADWSVDKRVANVDDNQVALGRAVRRITSKGGLLLLDGHFVLINERAEFVNLEIPVFESLGIRGVVLVEASPETIASRLAGRDSSRSAVDIESFIEEERNSAKAICGSLGVALEILFEPDYLIFSRAVLAMFDSAKREW